MADKLTSITGFGEGDPKNDARNKAIHAKLGNKGPKYPGYRTMTGVARRNARMDAIFERAKSEGRGLVGDSGTKGHGVNSPAMTEAKKKAPTFSEIKKNNPKLKRDSQGNYGYSGRTISSDWS